ncbi:MAG: hypothetical protein AB9873_09795 [Syntrophobacteraceae bacterium]
MAPHKGVVVWDRLCQSIQEERVLRRLRLFSALIGICTIFFVLMLVHAQLTQKEAAPVFEEKRKLVKKLCLTDLCLFTDARYTRHPTMADLHTSFQDYPMSLEHFTSGSLMAPPPHLRRTRER